MPQRVVAPKVAGRGRGGLGEFNVGALEAYEPLRGPFERERLLAFFGRRPLAVLERLGVVFQTFRSVQATWEAQESWDEGARTRADALRDGLASLGPVAVKVGQTLSQRPDLVGEEACEALKALQTRNVAFSNEAAYRATKGCFPFQL